MNIGVLFWGNKKVKNRIKYEEIQSVKILISEKQFSIPQ